MRISELFSVIGSRRVSAPSLVPSQKIDRTEVRAANNRSHAFTKRIAAHARLEWPENTDACWADEAGVDVRLAQYWLQDPPGRGVSAAGVGAVFISMLKRD